MEHRPLDLVEMGTADYDITHYQPVLYLAESIDEVVEVVGGFFRTCTDESIEEMRSSEATVKGPDGPDIRVVRTPPSNSLALKSLRLRDPMPLLGIDHVELWVGNAAQAAYFLRTAFGFSEVAYAGLETGSRDSTSHVLEQGRVRLVVTGSLRSDTRSPTTTAATATA